MPRRHSWGEAKTRSKCQTTASHKPPCLVGKQAVTIQLLTSPGHRVQPQAERCCLGTPAVVLWLIPLLACCYPNPGFEVPAPTLGLGCQLWGWLSTVPSPSPFFLSSSFLPFLLILSFPFHSSPSHFSISPATPWAAHSTVQAGRSKDAL